MKSSKGLLKGFILLLPILLVLGLAACDENNNMLTQDSGAQEPPPLGGTEATCPCFTLDDVTSEGDKASLIECANAVFGLAILFDSTDGFTAVCGSDGTGCGCGAGSNSASDISTDEYAACINNLLNGLIGFNMDSVKITNCELGR